MLSIKECILPTQKQLFKMLSSQFSSRAYVHPKKFILVQGNAPVMLIAHMDTVHKEPVRSICTSANGNILMSPQGIGGDDRCGVFALNKVYTLSKRKPWLLFTCDEEIGGVGAESFCRAYAQNQLPKELNSLKLLIEIDRKGSDDAVYYDCFNSELEEYVASKGFQTAFGSFSDISYIAPELGVAAVNLSSGYYNAHTLHEYIHLQELNATIDKVLAIVEESCAPEFPTFEYVSLADDMSLFDLEGHVSESTRVAMELLSDWYNVEDLIAYYQAYGESAIRELLDTEMGDIP